MTERGRAAPSWEWLTDLVLLCLALLGVAWSVVSVYHIEVVERAVWLGALAIAAASLVMARFPAVSVPALALWGFGVWRLWEPLCLGGARLTCDVVNTLAAKVPSIQTIDPIAKTAPRLWPQYATLWLAVVGVVFGYVLALLLCRGRWAGPCVLWTLLPILPALCVTEAPDPLPMGLLLAVWVTLLLTSAVARQDPRGTARLRPMALGGAVLTLAVLLHVMPTQGNSQPRWAAQARTDTFNAVRRMDLSQTFSGWRGSMGGGSTEYVSLTGGAAPSSMRTALRVHSTAAGKHYLRGWSSGVYTSTRWEPLGREAQRQLEDIMSTGFQPLLQLQQRIEQADSQWQRAISSQYPPQVRPRAKATMTVENVSAPGGCVYYPYALAQEPENAALSDDAHVSRRGWGWEHTVEFDRDIALVSLLDVKTKAPGDPETDAAEQRYRDFVYEHYLDVPEQLSGPLYQWLKNTGMGEPEEWSLEAYVRAYNRIYYSDVIYGDSYSYALPFDEDAPVTDEDRARLQPQYAVMVSNLMATLLAEEAQYDKKVSSPPEGEDYVNWFLNESKRGYCMHFASAGVMLMRSMGIPARYVSGYVVTVPASGTATVPASAAHAWGEIYLEGYGWYPVEFTPGFQGRDTGDLVASDFDPASDATPAPASTASAAPEPDSTPTPAVSQAPAETPTPTPQPSATPEGAGGGPPGKAGLLTVGVAAIAVLTGAIALHGWALRRRERRLAGEDTNAAVIWAYLCHKRLEPWGGKEDGALTALAEKARFSQHTLTEEERDTAVACYRREKARVRAALPGWKRPVFDLWFGKS